MPKSSIIARIKKLSMMTIENGCSEEEAGVAMKRITELMLEHDLTDNDIGPDESEYVMKTVPMPSVPRGGRDTLKAMANVIADAYHVESVTCKVMGKAHMGFYGRPSDADLAIFMLVSTIGFYRSARKESEAHIKGYVIPSLENQALKHINGVFGYDVEFKDAPPHMRRAFQKTINECVADHRLGFFQGFLMQMKGHFDTMKEKREQQAASSGYSLVPVNDVRNALREAYRVKDAPKKGKVKTGSMAGMAEGQSAAQNYQYHKGVSA